MTQLRVMAPSKEPVVVILWGSQSAISWVTWWTLPAASGALQPRRQQNSCSPTGTNLVTSGGESHEICHALCSTVTSVAEETEEHQVSLFHSPPQALIALTASRNPLHTGSPQFVLLSVTGWPSKCQFRKCKLV